MNKSINVTEEEMEDLIEQAIREGKIKFEDENKGEDGIIGYHVDTLFIEEEEVLE